MHGARVIGAAALLSCAAAGAPGAEPPGFERFRAIVDRQPFGVPAASAAGPSAAAAESGLAHLRLSALVESAAGRPRAGLVDQRSGRSYFLAAGEADDGLEVLSIAVDQETAQVRMDGETASLRLQGAPVAAARGIAGPVRVGTMGATATVVVAGPGGARAPGTVIRRRPPAPDPPVMRPLAVAEVPAGAAPPRPSPEEVDRQLRDYQMEVLRRGLPPLPIPLTPEMDEQLVKEGVLPAQ